VVGPPAQPVKLTSYTIVDELPGYQRARRLRDRRGGTNPARDAGLKNGKQECGATLAMQAVPSAPERIEYDPGERGRCPSCSAVLHHPPNEVGFVRRAMK
jgi:hypothetical protein